MFHFEKIKIEYFQKFENDHDCRGRGVLGGGGGGWKEEWKKMARIQWEEWEGNQVSGT